MLFRSLPTAWRPSPPPNTGPSRFTAICCSPYKAPKIAVSAFFVKTGSPAVLWAGLPVCASGSINLVKVHIARIICMFALPFPGRFPKNFWLFFHFFRLPFPQGLCYNQFRLLRRGSALPQGYLAFCRILPPVNRPPSRRQRGTRFRWLYFKPGGKHCAKAKS